MKKPSKKALAKIEADYQAELEAKNTFRARYHGKIFAAKVRWFDQNSGEGMVRIDDNLSLPIYACNIEGKKTWFPHTACVYYVENQIVQIKIDASCYSAIFAIGLTPGHFDAEHWDAIKDQGLAFRCNEKGEATNGLFSTGESK